MYIYNGYGLLAGARTPPYRRRRWRRSSGNARTGRTTRSPRASWLRTSDHDARPVASLASVTGHYTVHKRHKAHRTNVVFSVHKRHKAHRTNVVFSVHKRHKKTQSTPNERCVFSPQKAQKMQRRCEGAFCVFCAFCAFCGLFAGKSYTSWAFVGSKSVLVGLQSSVWLLFYRGLQGRGPG